MHFLKTATSLSPQVTYQQQIKFLVTTTQLVGLRTFDMVNGNKKNNPYKKFFSTLSDEDDSKERSNARRRAPGQKWKITGVRKQTGDQNLNDLEESSKQITSGDLKDAQLKESTEGESKCFEHRISDNFSK